MNNTNAGIVRFWPLVQVGLNSEAQPVKQEGGHESHSLMTAEKSSKMYLNSMILCPSNFNSLYNPLAYLSTISIYQEKSQKLKSGSLRHNFEDLHSKYKAMNEFNPLLSLSYLRPRQDAAAPIINIKETINISDDEILTKTGDSSPERACIIGREYFEN